MPTTATGKTAAFALPILHCLNKLRTLARHDPSTNSRSPAQQRREAIIAYTSGIDPRSQTALAAQIVDSFRNYGRHTPLRYAVIFGGISQNPQVRMSEVALDIVATPGRLLDLDAAGACRSA